MYVTWHEMACLWLGYRLKDGSDNMMKSRQTGVVYGTARWSHFSGGLSP